MVRKLELEIPDADYARLVQDAASRGQTPEQYLLRNGLPAANGTMPPKTMKFSDFFGTAESIVSDKELTADSYLMKYAGCLSSGDPNGSDNERIDADLAKEYGNEVD